ncbi:MAG: HlyC/CorC family transporter [Candidatus Aminicenantes bacterium]|nr:MAG: HlyC/CorC family transporter [Candidatus Aminicenantes bacterium]
MNYLIFSLLLIVTLLFYMLEVAFKSFSRISLAGFLKDFGNEKVKTLDYVENHEMVLHALRVFSFALQLTLFIYSYILLEPLIPNKIHRIGLLIILFLFIFKFLLYTLSFSKREAILGKLIYLTPAARIFAYPVNIIFSSIARKKPEDKETEPDDLGEKELEVFFEEGAKVGVLESEDKEMLESILEFGDTLVKEIMTPRVDMIYVDIKTKLDDLVKKINEAKKSRYPVISDRIDNIEGIILAKDVFDYWNHNQQDFSIKKILRKTSFVPETMRILELLKEMQRCKQKFAIVADEFGGISGVVTMEDIIEEIVGEIHDEYDEDTEPIVEEKDHFIVKGDTDISILNDTLKTKIQEDEDYQTVGGLISYVLGKIPAKGDQITLENHIFEVMEIEKHRVKKVRIYKTNSG